MAAGVEIRELPGSPLQGSWDARVEDWEEGGRRLFKLEEEHAGGYRRRVCSKCPHEQRVRRECSSLTPGCEELECDHMKRAFLRRHGRLIDEHIELHPLFVRMRLNSELEASRQARGTAP